MRTSFSLGVVNKGDKMIKRLICEIFDHKWDTSLWRAYVNKKRAFCLRCGRVEDYSEL